MRLSASRPLRLLALFVGMVAGTLLPLIALRLIEGPAPDWSCGQTAPDSAGPYLFWQQGAFLASATILALVLLSLSRERHSITWTSGRATAGAATIVALIAVLAVAAVFLALHVAFAIYGSFLALIAISLMQLGFLGGIAALALVSVVLIRSGRPDTNMVIRWMQGIGWSVLAVGLPIAFIFTAPIGPILC